MRQTFVRIGLTGGVGSGKSSVAELLREAGVAVINLDRLGRELTETSRELAAEIAELCGPSVLRDGRLDRIAVREVVFADARKRAALEKLLHPRIWSEFERRCEEVRDAGGKIVVCEAALLLEHGLHEKLDGIVLVLAPEETRKRRVMDRDRISAQLVDKMFRAQLGDEERRSTKAMLIENDGSLEKLRTEVNRLLNRWRAMGWLG